MTAKTSAGIAGPTASPAPGLASENPTPTTRPYERRRLVTTTPDKTVSWSVLRRYQETGKPASYDSLRFRCDRCGWVDSLETAEKEVIPLARGEARKKHTRQVCTACRWTTKTVNRRAAAAPAKPRKVTTTVKTEEVV